jgi:hypothetical protein
LIYIYICGEKPLLYHFVRHWPGEIKESAKDIDLYTTIVLAFYGSIEALFRIALKWIAFSSHADPNHRWVFLEVQNSCMKHPQHWLLFKFQ